LVAAKTFSRYYFHLRIPRFSASSSFLFTQAFSFKFFRVAYRGVGEAFSFFVVSFS